MEERLLLVFIKNAELGKVKTRLAAGVGDEKALYIYKKLVRNTKKAAQSVGAKKELWYSGFIPQKDDWPEEEFQKKVQKGENLGERMEFAFKKGFESGFKKIVIVGGDCPELKDRHIEKAFKALEQSEAVLGPANDGGYYLLGMNQFILKLFEEKPWGTSKVLEQTLDYCKKQNLRYKLLEKLIDVDTEQDWKKVRKLL